mmetsp:Transcript_16233/g.39662  ORF Transcript_16233/g.39662 Transcript_16233/m.39662 type:complete len:84 (+) Transcript_16233:84-335(+)
MTAVMSTTRSLRPLLSKSGSACYTTARRSSRQNIQHIDYAKDRHNANNNFGFGIVFGVGSAMGVGSAVVMSRCEGTTTNETEN